MKMNKSICIFIISIISINGFTIYHNLNKQTKLLSRKPNKINNLNIDFFDNDFYDVNYSLKINKFPEFITQEYEPAEKKKFPKTLVFPDYEPKGINQKNYVKYLTDKEVSLIFALGPAGSGKTLFACLQAIKALKLKSISKIILTRPVVPVEDEEIGYLPGDLQHKMDPWTKPIFDIFLEYYKQPEIDNMIRESIIEISPLSFMRGRTFKNSFIIADEMQNSTPNQMLMLSTRIGNGSKMVITGDLLQSDRMIYNGLSDIITKINNYKIKHNLNNIKIIEMTQSDIQRSELVKEILNIYNN